MIKHVYTPKQCTAAIEKAKRGDTIIFTDRIRGIVLNYEYPKANDFLPEADMKLWIKYTNKKYELLKKALK
jgi:hypothetical protein